MKKFIEILGTALQKCIDGMKKIFWVVLILVLYIVLPIEALLTLVLLGLFLLLIVLAYIVVEMARENSD